MAKITRYDGNFKAFGSDATGTERTVFGSTTRTDDLTTNLGAEYQRGWGVLPSGQKPPKQYFNGALFGTSQAVAYLHQAGVAEWNGKQEYHAGSITNRNGQIFVCLKNNHVSASAPETDSTNWRLDDGSVATISALLNRTTVGTVNVLNYHTGLGGGGGVFYWDASKPKTKHNGGTVIDPAKVFPTDWNNQTQLTTWFTAGSSGSGCWVRQYDGAVNVKWFGAKGDGVTDDSTAIRTAISSTAGTGKALDFGSATYLIDSTETPLSWELLSPFIRLPDKALTIVGNGYVLQSGTRTTGLCMIQTTYGSTAKISVSGGSIKGTGNTGSFVYGLVDGIVINGKTTNTVFDMKEIDSTKRHGYFIVDGATNNICKAKRISNTNRQMLGCGVQIEGASDNYVYVNTMYQIGANGLDINSFTASGYYPTGGGAPYNATNTSSYNKIFIDIIDGTGVNNNTGTGDFNDDDDYYGVNIIASTTNNNFVDIGEIKSVRVSSGTIAPALSTYASAIRLGLGCYNQTVLVGTVSIVGPSNSGALIKPDACVDCFVQIGSAKHYAGALKAPAAKTQGNTFIVQDIKNGSITSESLRGFEFNFVQQASCTTTLDGVLSGWSGDYGLTFTKIAHGLQIAVDTSTFKKIYKQLQFTYPYVTVNFEYSCNSVAGSIPTAGLDETPFSNITLLKDSAWHKTSVIITYTDGSQTFTISPNNSATAAFGQYVQIRNLTVTLPDGTTLGDSELEGMINGAPTVGTHTVNKTVRNYAPVVGQAKGWVCTVAGTPGTWVSLGNL